VDARIVARRTIRVYTKPVSGLTSGWISAP